MIDLPESTSLVSKSRNVRPVANIHVSQNRCGSLRSGSFRPGSSLRQTGTPKSAGNINQPRQLFHDKFGLTRAERVIPTNMSKNADKPWISVPEFAGELSNCAYLPHTLGQQKVNFPSSQKTRRVFSRRVAMDQLSDSPRIDLYFQSECSPTLMTILPKLRPSNRSRNACGAFSRPSTRCSRYLIFPSLTQRVISAANSG